MNFISVKRITPPIDRELVLVANEVTKTVKLSLEKATAHLWNEKEYPMPPKSLEALFYERLISISPRKREAAKVKIISILNDKTARSRAYGKLSAVDLKKNVEISKQIAQINGRTDKPANRIGLNSLLVPSSAPLASGRSSSGALDTLSLKIDAVQCVDETGSSNSLGIDPDGENTGDHIALAGNFVNEAGTTFAISQIDLGGNFGDNQFRETRIDLCNFDLLSNADVYPRYYFVNLTIAELDNGAFGSFANDVFRFVQDEVIKAMNDLAKAGLISLGGVLGGKTGAKIGELIAVAIAPVIAKVISDAFSWIKNVWEDDVYPPQTLSVCIPHRGALFMPNDGLMSSSRLNQELSLNFRREDGEYNLFLSWNVDWSFSNTSLVSIYGGSPTKNVQSKCFGSGKYDTGDLGIDNDSMFLAKVPKPFTLILFEHWKWLGKRIVYHSEDFGFLPPSFEGKVSSIVVTDNIDEVKKYGATLFEHANFQGKRKTFGSGQYNLIDYGFDNKISSIKTQLHPYYRVEIFDEPNCKGKSAVIDDDVSYVGNEWNDRVSSIRVTSWRELTTVHGTGTFIGKK